MNPVVLERRRSTLIDEARSLKDAVGDTDPSDEQRTRIDAIRTEVDSIDADLQRSSALDKLVEKDDKPEEKPADSEWEKRCRDYSLTAVVAEQCSLSGRRDTGSEREISDELSRRSGRSYEGTPVPVEALSTRAVTTTAPSAGPGSRIVPTDYRPGDYIDLLRDALVTRGLGIRVLRGLSGDVSIPKAQAGATAGWATETGALSEHDLEFDTPVTMSPRKVGAFGSWTARMMLQSSPDIEQLFRADFAASLAHAIDSAVITGGTGQEPDGVIATVTNTARTGDTNGLALTMAQIYDLALTVDQANIGQGQRAFLTDSATKYSLSQTLKFAGVGGTIWDGGQLLGMRAVASEIVPTEDHGTGTDLSQIIYGNWSDLILGYWQDLDLLVNPYESSAYKAGSVMIRLMAHADIAFRHEEAFGYYDAIIV